MEQLNCEYATIYSYLCIEKEYSDLDENIPELIPVLEQY